MEGRIVYSKAGRDRGNFLVVIRAEENAVYVCDGKERPLSRPKRKNRKHIGLTGTTLGPDSLATDRSLRKALAIYRDSAAQRRNPNV